MPMCMFASFQILTPYGNCLFKMFDAILNSLYLWIHKNAFLLTGVKTL